MTRFGCLICYWRGYAKDTKSSCDDLNCCCRTIEVCSKTQNEGLNSNHNPLASYLNPSKLDYNAFSSIYLITRDSNKICWFFPSTNIFLYVIFILFFFFKLKRLNFCLYMFAKIRSKICFFFSFLFLYTFITTFKICNQRKYRQPQKNQIQNIYFNFNRHQLQSSKFSTKETLNNPKISYSISLFLFIHIILTIKI